MNRDEVIFTIKKVGTHFGKVMACLVTPEYAAGYRQAVYDMARLFEYAPIDPDFEAERQSLVAKIRKLKAKNMELEQTVRDQEGSIETLMHHVDIYKVLGIKGVKR